MRPDKHTVGNIGDIMTDEVTGKQYKLVNIYHVDVDGDTHDEKTYEWDEIKSEGGSGGSSILADWNQNNENAADYVKNRTHWKEFIKGAELFPTITDFGNTFNTNGISLGYKKIILGATYHLTLNGTEYESVSWHDSGFVYIGNGNIWGLSEGNDEPFVAVEANGILYIDFMDSGLYDTEVTIGCKGDYEAFHKLPKEYAPETMSTVYAIDKDENDNPYQRIIPELYIPAVDVSQFGVYDSVVLNTDTKKLIVPSRYVASLGKGFTSEFSNSETTDIFHVSMDKITIPLYSNGRYVNFHIRWKDYSIVGELRVTNDNITTETFEALGICISDTGVIYSAIYTQDENESMGQVALRKIG